MTIKSALLMAGFILALALVPTLAARSGFVDPSVSERVMGAIFGLILAFFANVVPKNLSPLSDSRCDPAKAQSYRRFSGWAMVLAGLGSAIVWMTFTIALANYVSMAIIATSVLLVAAVCVIARRGSQSPAES